MIKFIHAAAAVTLCINESFKKGSTEYKEAERKRRDSMTRQQRSEEDMRNFFKYQGRS